MEIIADILITLIGDKVIQTVHNKKRFSSIGNSRMIYLDQAAHSWPKPVGVYKVLAESFFDSLAKEEAETRVKVGLANLLNAPNFQQFYFTHSATEALDWAIHILLMPKDHVLTTSMGHQASLTPLYAIQSKGVELEIIQADINGEIDTTVLLGAIKKNTRAIILTHASNVAGNLQPIQEIADEAHKFGVWTLVDAAQTVGVYPIDLAQTHIDALAFSGHKGLFSPVGIGGLVVSSEEIRTRLEKSSAFLNQSLAPSASLLTTLAEGVSFVQRIGVSHIRQHEMVLTQALLSGLQKIANVKIYGSVNHEKRIGIVAFTISGYTSSQIAQTLEQQYGIVCRVGLHHAEEACKTLGADSQGVVRLGVGWSNTLDDITYTLDAISEIVQPKSLLSTKSWIGTPKHTGPTRPNILLISQKQDILAKPNSDWSYLAEIAYVDYLSLDQEKFFSPANSPSDPWENCLRFIAPFCNHYDYVLAESPHAFLWHAIFRTAGDQTPFGCVPKCNPVLANDIFVTLLSSQLSLDSDIVFAGTNTAKRAFGLFGFHSSALSPLGIDLHLFRPLARPKPELRAHLGLPTKFGLLFYNGCIDTDHHVIELLESFKQVNSQIEAHLIMSVPYKDTEYFHACIDLANTIGNVSWRHHLSDKSLVEYYNAADLFISAEINTSTTASSESTEALGCGTPAVAFQYNGFRDTIPATCGFLVPTVHQDGNIQPNVTYFAQTIIFALQNPDLLKEMGRYGRLHAQRFERTQSIHSMLQELRAPLSKIHPESHSLILNLRRYPPELRSLWSQLEGQVIPELLASFIRTGQSAPLVSAFCLDRFRELWFAHY